MIYHCVVVIVSIISVVMCLQYDVNHPDIEISGHAKWSYSDWKHIFDETGLTGSAHLRSLEIGCFQGRTTMWVMKYLTTHPTSTHTCIDPMTGADGDSNIQAEEDKLAMVVDYTATVSPYGNRVRLFKEQSSVGLLLPEIRSQKFHFIYVDGDHRAQAALEDAVLAFRLLAVHGVMIFDDYWGVTLEDIKSVDYAQVGVDSFLAAYKGYYFIVDYSYQLSIQKSKELP